MTTWPGTPTTTEFGGTGLIDHGIGANPAACPYDDCAENLGACADHHIIFQGWVAFAFFQAGPAQGDAVVQGHIVANFRRLTDHHPHAMIDEEFVTDRCPWVDLDPGQKPDDMREPAGQKLPVVLP